MSSLLSLILSAIICFSATSCSYIDSSESSSRSSSSSFDSSYSSESSLSESSSNVETSSKTDSSSNYSETISSSKTTSSATTTSLTTTTSKVTTTTTTTKATPRFNPSLIPTYSGSAYVAINGNIPFFSASDMTTKAYETYSPLDNLGRCGAAMSCIGRELMPTESRGSIGMVKPSGWHLVKYQGIEGKYLYNRCHLIGYQLTGENANERNLVTGTRYMNVQGMEPIENRAANYIKSTGNHVIYRSTPIFIGSNLVCSGVLMEGKSVEDNGAGLTFCVFAYNVQPGVTINYADGSSSGPEYIETQATTKATTAKATNNNPTPQPSSSYVLNKNTHKFHYPSCSSVSKMAEKNKVYFNGTRDQVISQGYSPCNRCNP
ncbi:MAG: DNA/RNA non-specific endonuclease [Ruminococcus sp.]|nr:DNA/RNA non-specific endonuclease [Ruminococcus sp.]